MRRVSVFLITLALLAGMVGCVADPVHDPDPEPDPDPDIRHELSISATIGGSVTSPGEGTFEYDGGTVVSVYAVPDECYRFVNWTGDTVANPASAVTTVTMDADKSITANFALARYTLRVYSRVGGVVISPSEEESDYDCGTVVDVVAEAEEGYQFTHWTGNVGAVDDVNCASTTVTMMADYSITANFAKELRTWYDLDAIRDNLSGHYVLMNDLDSSTAGYAELAGPTADDGRGWQPIGRLSVDPDFNTIVLVRPFSGSLDGREYAISDLCVERIDGEGIGLFGSVGGAGTIKNVRLVNAEVTGHTYVGSLAGSNFGTVDGCLSAGSVSGSGPVGGQIGYNGGTVSNSYSAGVVSGEWSSIGGLVGLNYWGSVIKCDSSTSVSGGGWVGGLVGANGWGTLSNSRSSGSVTGQSGVGGLLGRNWGIVSNSHYDYDDVLINGEAVITIGALSAEDYEQWLANGRSLEVDERLSRQHGYYLINSVSDFRELLAFGQDDSLRFRLTADLDLSDYPNLYIPYLAGEFYGDGHEISNLAFNSDCASQVGVFGYLATGAKITHVGVRNLNITGDSEIGGLVGFSNGRVINSYAIGNVAGHHRVGGLVGVLHLDLALISNSYAIGSATGDSSVGGLVGWQYYGTVRNSHYSYDQTTINGETIITIGALCGEDFEQWLANGKSLNVDERLSREGGYYLINSVSDLRELLAFGQYDSLKFRLEADLDLADQPNFYIPYLAGQFDGNGHTISNLTVRLDSVSQVGLFGYLAKAGEISRVGVENADITGDESVGAVVGYNHRGFVSGSWASGTVSARGSNAGGVVGRILSGTVRDSYSKASVSGSWDVGGLAGSNRHGYVWNSYSTGSVTGNGCVGGLVGNSDGSVINSFWDVEASGLEESDGGRGKTTAEMKDIATFVRWDIVAVALSETNTAYTWNIVDGQTYPFLSWEPVT